MLTVTLATGTSGWDIAATIATIIAAIAFVATLVVYSRQLAAMQAQVATMRRTDHANAVLHLLDLLQAEEARADRRVINKSAQYNGRNWGTDVKAAAERVAQVYNSIGFMVEQDLLKADLVIDNWAPSIIDMWAKVSPLIFERRDRQTNPSLWTSFGTSRR